MKQQKENPILIKRTMINSVAYREWQDLFDKNVSKVWLEEPFPILKKLSMVFFSLQKEIKQIEDQIYKDVSDIRKNVIEAQDRKTIVVEFQSTDSNSNNKENIQFKKSEPKLSPQKHLSDNITVDSPEMFQNVEPPLSGSNDSGSIIISDEDTPSTLTSSPEIKKKKRNAFQKRRRLRNTAAVSTMSFLNSQEKSDNCSQQNDEKGSQSRVVDDKSSLDFFKELVEHTPKPEDPIKGDTVLPLREDCSSDIINKKLNLVLTPVRNDCDLDLSIVQCTPVSVSLSKRKDRMPSYLSKKKSRRDNGTTLTQLFSRHDKKKNVDKERQKANYDSDETYCTPIHSTITSETSSVMGITRMVSYMNTNSPLKEKIETTSTKIETDTKAVINLDPNTQEIADMVEDIRYEDFEDDNSLNSAIVEENEDDEAEVSFKLNDFLARAQNVPEHQLDAEPLVRGKARQKLPSWSCKDCEKFYTKQGLNSKEVLALNKCSKHRGYYRPREETLPGFWDMHIGTPETENTQ